MMGDEEHLNIKGPSINDLYAKEILGCDRAEALEATLGILNPRKGHDSYQKIKPTTDPMSVEWFTISDSSLDLTGGDGDVHVKLWWDEMVHLIDGHGKICITDEPKISNGFEHTSTNCQTFTSLRFT
jgi:hypothetical protein